MPPQRQTTQTVIEVSGRRNMKEYDVNTAHQMYHVGMLSRKPYYGSTPYAGLQSYKKSIVMDL
jgi:hypothetical protein